MNWERKLRFMYWLVDSGIALLVPFDLKADGNKYPIMLKGDKYPQMSGYYQLSETGKSGLWDNKGNFHQFEKKLDMVNLVQVDIFG